MTTNLRSLDLNLLLVFEAILREGSVARAAERLHLSQPATSHALSRLRHRLKDQLFVRTPAGMTPTPRAERLARPVRRALDELQLALEPDAFSPATAERSFVVALNNFGAIAPRRRSSANVSSKRRASACRYDQVARSMC